MEAFKANEGSPGEIGRARSVFVLRDEAVRVSYDAAQEIETASEIVDNKDGTFHEAHA